MQFFWYGQDREYKLKNFNMKNLISTAKITKFLDVDIWDVKNESKIEKFPNFDLSLVTINYTREIKKKIKKILFYI